jgi:hypothetical protein
MYVCLQNLVANVCTLTCTIFENRMATWLSRINLQSDTFGGEKKRGEEKGEKTRSTFQVLDF